MRNLINSWKAAEAAAEELMAENGVAAYHYAASTSTRPTPRYDKTPTNATQADLDVYAKSLRAEAERIDNTSFLGWLLGL
jgi:hypothetical protein